MQRPRPLVAVRPTDSLASVVRTLFDRGCSMAPVLCAESKGVGKGMGVGVLIGDPCPAARLHAVICAAGQACCNSCCGTQLLDGLPACCRWRQRSHCIPASAVTCHRRTALTSCICCAGRHPGG